MENKISLQDGSKSRYKHTGENTSAGVLEGNPWAPYMQRRMIDGLGSWSMNIDRNNNKSKAESSLSFLSALIRPIGCCVREFILSTSPSENWYSISIASRLFCTAPLVIYIQDRVDNWAGPQNIRNPLSLFFIFTSPSWRLSFMVDQIKQRGAPDDTRKKKREKMQRHTSRMFCFFPASSALFWISQHVPGCLYLLALMLTLCSKLYWV